MARGYQRGGDPDANLPGDDGPVDVAAVRRDDALIDAIAGGGPVATDSLEQYELALLLTNWRADIVSAPMPTGPTLDDIIAVMDTGGAQSSSRSAARGRLRLLRPIAGAAAAVAVIMGGATIFSYNAEPGDPLWSVKSVVFSEQANSTVAKIDTTSQLQEAERLIAAGDTDSAKSMLATAAQRAGGVRDADKRNELEVWRAKLATELEKIAPSTSVAQPPPQTTTTATTTSVPPQSSQVPSSTAPTSGSTVSGVPPQTTGGVQTGGVQPGGVQPPTDLQIPGLPAIPLPQLPQLPTEIPLPQSTTSPDSQVIPLPETTSAPDSQPVPRQPARQSPGGTTTTTTTTVPVPSPPTS